MMQTYVRATVLAAALCISQLAFCNDDQPCFGDHAIKSYNRKTAGQKMYGRRVHHSANLKKQWVNKQNTQKIKTQGSVQLQKSKDSYEKVYAKVYTDLERTFVIDRTKVD